MPFVSPLRYPGGKRRLASFIKLVYQYNDLLGGHYVEPFAGGASVALLMLYEGYASHIHINDISRPIYAFWYSVLNHTESLCRRIHDTRVCMAEWHVQKQVLESSNQETDLLELGFSAFFLNRTNRSGILGAGVIGGKNQEGDYRLDARFNKKDLTERIYRVARHRDCITLRNQDAQAFLLSICPKLPWNTLVYLDPPYYVKGSDLYENHYVHVDHVHLAQVVQELSLPWMVSYDNVREVELVYADHPKLVYDLSYSIGERHRGSEVMFYSTRLRMPLVDNPGRISDRLFRQLQDAPRLI